MDQPRDTDIHPTAAVAPTARLGRGCRIGAFAVIEDDVELGEDCVIAPHGVVRAHTRLGARCRVEPGAVIGGAPQDLGFDPATVSYLVAGDDCVFREGVTLNRATRPDGATRLGARCYLMNNAHVAHDCTLGDGVIFATGVAVGGHVHVGDNAFIGGGAMVHQFCRVGSRAIVRGLSAVDKDVLPYSMAGGVPVKHYRLNLIGLRRSGIGGDRLKTLSTAFRRLRARQSLDDLESTAELEHLKAWLAAESKRGVHGFAGGGRSREDGA